MFVLFSLRIHIQHYSVLVTIIPVTLLITPLPIYICSLCRWCVLRFLYCSVLSVPVQVLFYGCNLTHMNQDCIYVWNCNCYSSLHIVPWFLTCFSCMLHTKCHVVLCHQSMARPRFAIGADGLQIWRVTANISNKQSQTVNKGWSLVL
jgi:hypothetical protein